MAYTYIKPKYSQLYLNEYSFLGNLRYFSLTDLLRAESLPTQTNKPRLDANGELRGLAMKIILSRNKLNRTTLNARTEDYLFETPTLLEVKQSLSQKKKREISELLNKIESKQIYNKMKYRYHEYARWISSVSSIDQRQKQKYYLELAHLLWETLSIDSFENFQDIAWKTKVPARNLFRIFGIWLKYGFIDMIDLNRDTKGHEALDYDIKRKCKVITPVLYIMPKEKVSFFNQEWKKVAKQKRSSTWPGK